MQSKKRSLLRAKASKLDTKLIIGKGGMNQETLNHAFNIVNKDELLKGKVLKTCAFKADEAAKYIAENIGAQVICKIGNKFVLYKKIENKETKKTTVKSYNKVQAKAKKVKKKSLNKNFSKSHKNTKLSVRTNSKISYITKR